MKKLLKIIILLHILGLAFFLGYIVKPAAVHEPAEHVIQPEEGPTMWTCAMHPNIQLPEPGQCPTCFMDLVPVKKGTDGDEHPRRLVMSEAAKELAEIQTALVIRQGLTKTISLVGKVGYDETRLAHITTWAGGRIDRLFYNFTGVDVVAQTPMVYLYSPSFLSAQEEYLQALKAETELADSADELSREMVQATTVSAWEKLRLLGFNPQQIDELRQSQQASDHVTIYAPISGTVIQKNGFEGMYVKTGTRIYTVADLSQVWVMLDAYESDLKWLHEQQPVEFTTDAYPNDVFKGRIDFIEPEVTEPTRTIKVRVNVPNTNRKLKPNMFVRGTIKVPILKYSDIFLQAPSEQWTCPMHPEVMGDEPSSCPICKMDLVPVKTGQPDDLPLVIPATAPLITGQRAVVYVEVPNTTRPTYEGREIELGPRVGEFYLVKSGLQKGERVVIHGSFKIDSDLQIQAKPSMMSPQKK